MISEDMSVIFHYITISFNYSLIFVLCLRLTLAFDTDWIFGMEGVVICRMFD